MDIIQVKSGIEQLTISNPEDGISVILKEENLAVTETEDKYSVTVNDEKIVLEDSKSTLTIIDGDEKIPVQFSDVFIQSKTVNVPATETDLEMPYNLQVDFVGTDTVYKGWADPGTPTSSALWRIQRITFVGTDEDVVIEWANGNGNFENIWDDHLSLSYM